MVDAAWKPWAAGLLVVGAIAMIGRNLIAPFLRRPPAAIEAQVPGNPESGIQGTSTLPDSTPKGVDGSHLEGWNLEEARDPFGSSGRRQRLSETGGGQEALPTSRSLRPPKLRIDAIAWGKVKMALVNGVPVGVGDSMSGGVLLDVYPDHLALRSPAGDTVLRFREVMKP